MDVKYIHKLSVRDIGTQLIVRRNLLGSLPMLVFLALVEGLLIYACFAPVPERPGGQIGTVASFLIHVRVSAIVSLMICTFVSIRAISSLRPFVFVFDQEANLVSFNDCRLQALEELQSVCLERSHYRLSRSSNSTLVLYLRTKSGGKTELARDGMFGLSERELEETSRVIADFLGIDLVTPDGFTPGWRETSLRPPEPIRWGGKRREAPVIRRPKARLKGILKP